MWTKEIMGVDIYHLLACFIIYSILGWFVESVFMTVCNKKITNRGFTLSPFCPIYGFGAIIGYFLLSPLSDNLLHVYLGGAISATIFEFLVGTLMIRLFGELWWDYNAKPFNYKGIICLESTIAWGFYAIGIVIFLNTYIMQYIDLIPIRTGILLMKISVTIVAFDFTYHLLEALGINIKEYKNKMKEKCSAIKTRWY